MNTYDFIGKVTLANVQSIITGAGFDSADYTYAKRVDNDGYLVEGTPPMSTTLLRNAARALHLKVEISSASARGAVAGDLAGSPYAVSFTMSQATVQALQGYSLVVFKGVQGPNATPGSAVPLAWIVSDTFGLNTDIKWEEDYSAYTSTAQIVPGGTITASNPVSIDIGETYNVDASGTGPVTEAGQSNAITIQNTSTTQFVCGLAQTPAGSTVANAICAFTLHGQMADVMIPEEKIFMMFVSATVDTGKVFEKSIGPGLLVDLTGVEKRSGIAFDINSGWSWGGFSWAKGYQASSDLVPLLIDNSANFKASRPSLSLAA